MGLPRVQSSSRNQQQSHTQAQASQLSSRAGLQNQQSKQMTLNIVNEKNRNRERSVNNSSSNLTGLQSGGGISSSNHLRKSFLSQEIKKPMQQMHSGQSSAAQQHSSGPGGAGTAGIAGMAGMGTGGPAHQVMSNTSLPNIYNKS